MWLSSEELIWIFVPMVSAFIISWLIGFERQNIGKAAGISPHVLVCVASCAISIMQHMLYDDALANGHAVDSQRIIAQVVTGIGFIGAGVIMKSSRTIKGLTTASTLWSCAILGLILGYGEKYYLLGLILGSFLIGFMYIRDMFRHLNPFKPRDYQGDFHHDVENYDEH
jgi:putative Mg2+ transporter-C (MgtC) family protein